MKKPMKSYEGSKADNAKDAREAKKRGMSVKAFEGSKADMAEDKKGAKKAGVPLKSGGRAAKC